MSLFSRYWEQLVWMDPANYAGIKGKSSEEMNGTDDDVQEEEDDEDKDETVTNL